MPYPEVPAMSNPFITIERDQPYAILPNWMPKNCFIQQRRRGWRQTVLWVKWPPI